MMPALLITVVLAVAAPPAVPARNAWMLSTSDTRIAVEVADDQVMIRRLECAANPYDWASDDMAVPLMPKVWVGAREHALQWRFVEGALNTDGTTLTLAFQNESPRMALESIWRARPGRGPVEHWVTLENQTGERLTLAHQDSLSLSTLRMNASAEVWWIKRGGSNASIQGGTFVEPFTAQLDLDLASDCNDGASPAPWLAVQSGDGHGLYVGWEFSGLGRIAARANVGALGIHVGLMPDFKTDVEPGEVFRVPPAFVGCYAGDIDEGAYALHQWVLQYLRPHLPEDIPDPILTYNLYLDAGGPNATEADVLRSAEFCRDLGFEAFMPDAMWFPACGDWRWDPARFPNGVTPIEEYVHKSGMRLALWCAWTNGGVAEHPDALSVRGAAGRPDWFDADYPPDWNPGPFYGGRVCLACPEARAWEIKKTQWLVSNHKLDYLKHDCGPIVSQCNKTTHRHAYGVDASYWAATGYYEVQEKLRAAFPRIILENCSGGGHIKDFGVIQYTHYTVTTDTLSNLPDRQSIYDSTFAFPPILLQAYTYEREYKVPGDDPGSYLWRSAMMGAWQIDPTNTRIWTEDEKASAQKDAQVYKDWIRPMLKDVKVHHILPRPDGTHWDGMFYWSPGLKRGTLYIFRPDADEDRKTIRLKGLDSAQTYWVWCEDGSVAPGARSGSELMDTGLDVALPARYSCDLVYLRDAGLGKPEGLDAPTAFGLGQVDALSDPFQASAKLSWQASANARSYRVVIARTPEFKDVVMEKTVAGPSALFSNLPPEQGLFWKVEAVGWGGKRPHDGDCGVFTTPPLLALPDLTFVSDMEWLRATAGADNAVRRDINRRGKGIAIAGKPYPKGVWTHAFSDSTPADVVVSIAGQGFGTFKACAGVEDSAGAGSVQFQVLADGVLKAESPVMTARGEHLFDVDVSGAHEVTLRVLNGGDGYTCDHAAWGLARFVKAGARDPL